MMKTVTHNHLLSPNVMSLLDKFKDLRKIMEVQQSLKNEHGNKDMNAQINLIEIVRPMLPEEQAENIDNLKKWHK